MGSEGSTWQVHFWVSTAMLHSLVKATKCDFPVRPSNHLLINCNCPCPQLRVLQLNMLFMYFRTSQCFRMTKATCIKSFSCLRTRQRLSHPNSLAFFQTFWVLKANRWITSCFIWSRSHTQNVRISKNIVGRPK